MISMVRQPFWGCFTRRSARVLTKKYVSSSCRQSITQHQQSLTSNTFTNRMPIFSHTTSASKCFTRGRCSRMMFSKITNKTRSLNSEKGKKLFSSSSQQQPKPSSSATANATSGSGSSKTTNFNVNNNTATRSFMDRFLGPKEMPEKGTFAWYREMVLICTVFAITGSSTMIMVRPAVSNVLGIKGSFKDGPWSYRISSLVIMTPIYSMLLVAVGTIFGRHAYFRHFAVKMISRFGIPPESLDKTFHETKKTFRKW